MLSSSWVNLIWRKMERERKGGKIVFVMHIYLNLYAEWKPIIEYGLLSFDDEYIVELKHSTNALLGTFNAHIKWHFHVIGGGYKYYLTIYFVFPFFLFWFDSINLIEMRCISKFCIWKSNRKNTQNIYTNFISIIQSMELWIRFFFSFSFVWLQSETVIQSISHQK